MPRQIASIEPDLSGRRARVDFDPVAPAVHRKRRADAENPPLPAQPQAALHDVEVRPGLAESHDDQRVYRLLQRAGLDPLVAAQRLDLRPHRRAVGDPCPIHLSEGILSCAADLELNSLVQLTGGIDALGHISSR